MTAEEVVVTAVATIAEVVATVDMIVEGVMMIAEADMMTAEAVLEEIQDGAMMKKDIEEADMEEETVVATAEVDEICARTTKDSMGMRPQMLILSVSCLT